MAAKIKRLYMLTRAFCLLLVAAKAPFLNFLKVQYSTSRTSSPSPSLPLRENKTQKNNADDAQCFMRVVYVLAW